MCNKWALDFAAKAARYIVGGKILEVGSRDVNGSIRPIFENLRGVSYLGVDLVEGERVDQVIDVCKLDTVFEPASFDAVLTTEMLEHCYDWKAGIIQMVRVIKPGGLLLLTTRSPGFELHGYPYDFWRFSSQDLETILKPISEILELDDDLTLGWACGVGIIVRIRSIDQKAFADWREMIGAMNVFSIGEITIDKLIPLLEEREKEIQRLQHLAEEQTAWAIKNKEMLELQSAEIARLQELLNEQTNWAQQSSATVLDRDAEILRLQALINSNSK